MVEGIPMVPLSTHPPKRIIVRDLIHEHVSRLLTKFGIDLIIGSDADREINVREKMYIPSYLMNRLKVPPFTKMRALLPP